MPSYNNRNNRFATKAIHAAFHHDPMTGAVMPSIVLSTTFAQKSPGQPLGDFEYARTANPTREILQNNLAALENAKYGLCFSSGCAALATLLHRLSPGAHIILSDDIYGGSYRLFQSVFSKWDLRITLCDMTDLNAFKAAYTANTQLVWLETPSNPMLKILDIAALSEIHHAQKSRALFAVDNTFATPYLQNPLDLGADLVCHSTTKYLGGHSDVVGGALLLNNPKIAEELTYLQNAIGAIPSPQDCYLLLRSIKTLAVRMEAHCANALLISNYLNKHPKIERVIYPGLTIHPQYLLAQRQMRRFGGMISINLKGNLASTIAFLQKLKIFTLAESLGGVESLIEHPALMTHMALPIDQRLTLGILDTLVRVSVGIEDPQDLIEDLAQALG